jgi:hypothetical protein
MLVGVNVIIVIVIDELMARGLGEDGYDCQQEKAADGQIANLPRFAVLLWRSVLLVFLAHAQANRLPPRQSTLRTANSHVSLPGRANGVLVDIL